MSVDTILSVVAVMSVDTILSIVAVVSVVVAVSVTPSDEPEGLSDAAVSDSPAAVREEEL